MRLNSEKEFIKMKIRIIEDKLKSKEWIPIKVMLGEWEKDDVRYQNYLSERAKLRNEHQILLDELKNEIEDLIFKGITK